MLGYLNSILPSRAQSQLSKSKNAPVQEKTFAQLVLDNQQQILNELQGLKADQVALSKATQAILSQQHQDYLSHFWSLSNTQSNLQNLQSRIFSDQRAMIQQLETLKNRLPQFKR